jgi:23S rRNA (cytosine1962-C5)-methyltransferase
VVTLTVKQKRIGPVTGRHPWVYSQALTAIPDGLQSGESVTLQSENGAFLALGYFNSYSQIAVRLWGYDETEEIDQDFFVARVERAYRLRTRYVETPETNAYRLINGESDLLPGLIVDKYADYLVVQFHTRGIEFWKGEILAALEKVVSPKGIYERSDVGVRRIDGLGDATGVLAGAIPDLITIKENGFVFLVDVRNGQKTGFYLDQRDKRQAFMKYARDATVLNCFSYTGGFSVYALAGRARSVTHVDTSEMALDLAKENIKLNGFDIRSSVFLSVDAKAYLRSAPDTFDAIVLDPPAFIKDRRKRNEGLTGYRTINEKALRLLSRTGILVTCSCSAHLSLMDFRYLLSEVGGRLRKPLQLLEVYTHGLDHPRLVPFTEGDYLKCFIMKAG